ncbi:MAG TPA: acyl-CoA dehydrogenase family protein [Acidimicrobiia bacterium]|nr:acyl-CoA dehydrogenase family protein [Acidimicrobiia bacterium]
MDLTFSDDQLALRAEVADFLAAERAAGSFTPQVDAWITGFDRAFSKKMAARGWIGLTWPAEYGGGGRTYVDRLCMTELLLAAGAPLASHWFADRQMGPSIMAHGTPAQKERYLPEVLSGDATYCIGMSEPQAGSDLAGVRTRATRSGDGWVVTGHKVWTSLAHHSDYIYLLVRTDPASDRHDGLSELIVPMRSEGITISPINDMSGAHHFNEVFFDEVTVGADALIGTEGNGWRQITGQLGYERSGLERIMSTWALFEAMRAAAGDDERRLEEVGALEAAARVARLLVFRAAAVADTGRAPDHEAAMAKVFATDIEQRMVEVASQWAGRAARTGEAFGGHLLTSWLIAPSFSIRGGTNEVLRGIIARRALGL